VGSIAFVSLVRDRHGAGHHTTVGPSLRAARGIVPSDAAARAGPDGTELIAINPALLRRKQYVGLVRQVAL
jgi:hypothetical protein